LTAQTVKEDSPAQPKAREVSPVEKPLPFSLSARGRDQLIEFRATDQMIAKDREVVANAESSIAERAKFLGMEFDEGKWNYEQVVCSAIPNHILLRFTRNNGTGDSSVFSVSIPRNGDGRVRIIPIQMRGYSLFSPAPVNAMAISAFNRIRSEEHFDTPPDWLATGLCYAGLTGGRPQVALSVDRFDGSKNSLAAPPKLQIQHGGNVILSFVDLSTAQRPIEWTMEFDGHGKLLRILHKAAGLMQQRVLHPASIDLNRNGVPAS
jgi:hypothetical protein